MSVFGLGPLQGLVSYPGLSGSNSFTRATYTNSYGISPGQVVIEMPQQNVGQLERQGDVTFSYGEASFSLSDCIVDSVNVDTAESGYIARVVILDRRWRWHPTKGGGYILGHYNLPMPGGVTSDGGFNDAGTFNQPTIRPGTQMAPQDLATLCLQAMNEQDFDVSALPNDTNPEVHWSYANPAEALNQLCDELGCRIVLNVMQDYVQIVTIGQGDQLPIDGTVEFPSVGANPPETPASLLFVGGPTIIEDDVPLVAVCYDTDGSIKPIDKLSYAPQGGWINESLLFANVAAQSPGNLNYLPLVLCQKYLYRMWQVKTPFTTYVASGQSVTVQRPDQVHLYDRTLASYPDVSNPGNVSVGKPHLWGVMAQNFAQDFGVNTSGPPTKQNPVMYSGDVSVDSDRSLIISDGPIYYTTGNGGEIHPASDTYLAARIAFSLHDPDNWELLRYTNEQTLNPDSGSGPRIVRHEEVVRKVTVNGSSSGSPSVTTNDENDNLDGIANYYLGFVASEYVEQDSLDITYADLKMIPTDGLVQQVTWTITAGPGGGTTTRASQATEHNPYVPRYRTRRQTERQSRQPQAQAKRQHGFDGLKSNGVIDWK